MIRSGEVAANINPQEMTEQELAKLMIGSDLPEIMSRPEIKPHPGLEVCFQGEEVGFKSRYPLYGKINVPCGRIVGVAGISGNGQAELMKQSAAKYCCPKTVFLSSALLPETFALNTDAL